MNKSELKFNLCVRKKAVIAFLSVMNAFSMYAQSDVRAELNTVMADYALPIVVTILVISVVTGLITNMDKIVDKHDDGSRKEGVINVIWYLAYAIFFIVVVAAVITLFSKFSLSI